MASVTVIARQIAKIHARRQAALPRLTQMWGTVGTDSVCPKYWTETTANINRFSPWAPGVVGLEMRLGRMRLRRERAVQRSSKKAFLEFQLHKLPMLTRVKVLGNIVLAIFKRLVVHLGADLKTEYSHLVPCAHDPALCSGRLTAWVLRNTVFRNYRRYLAEANSDQLSMIHFFFLDRTYKKQKDHLLCANSRCFGTDTEPCHKLESRHFLEKRICISDRGDNCRAHLADTIQLKRKARIRDLLLAARGLDRRVDELAMKALHHRSITGGVNNASLSYIRSAPRVPVNCDWLLISDARENCVTFCQQKGSGHSIKDSCVASFSFSRLLSCSDLDGGHTPLLSKPFHNQERVKKKNVQHNSQQIILIEPRPCFNKLSVINQVAYSLVAKGKSETKPKHSREAIDELCEPDKNAYLRAQTHVNIGLKHVLRLNCSGAIVSTMVMGAVSNIKKMSMRFPATTPTNKKDMTCFVPFGSLQGKLIEEVQWQAAIVASTFELANFERRRALVLTRKEVAIVFTSHASEAVIRSKRIELANQRTAYEAAIHHTLSELHEGQYSDSPMANPSSTANPNTGFTSKPNGTPINLRCELKKKNLFETTSFETTNQSISRCRVAAVIDHWRMTAQLIRKFESSTQQDSSECASSLYENQLPTSNLGSPTTANMCKKCDSMLIASTSALLACLQADFGRHVLRRRSLINTQIVKGDSTIVMDSKLIVPSRVPYLTEMGNSNACAPGIVKLNLSDTYETGATPPHRIGDRIEAQFGRGRTWFFGWVTKFHDKFSAYDVEYEDGDVDITLPSRFIRVPLSMDVAPYVYSANLERVVERHEEPRVDHQVSINTRTLDTASDMELDDIVRTSVICKAEMPVSSTTNIVKDKSFGPDPDNGYASSMYKPSNTRTVSREHHLLSISVSEVSLDPSTLSIKIPCDDKVYEQDEDYSEEDNLNTDDYANSSMPGRCHISHSDDKELQALEVSVNDHQLKVTLLREALRAKGREQIRLNASIDAINRRIALRDLENELHLELNVTEACIESTKKRLDEIGLSKASLLLERDLSSSLAIAGAAIIPRTAESLNLNRTLELLLCDHVEIAKSTSMFKWLCVLDIISLHTNSFEGLPRIPQCVQTVGFPVSNLHVADVLDTPKGGDKYILETHLTASFASDSSSEKKSGSKICSVDTLVTHDGECWKTNHLKEKNVSGNKVTLDGYSTCHLDSYDYVETVENTSLSSQRGFAGDVDLAAVHFWSRSNQTIDFLVAYDIVENVDLIQCAFSWTCHNIIEAAELPDKQCLISDHGIKKNNFDVIEAVLIPCSQTHNKPYNNHLSRCSIMFFWTSWLPFFSELLMSPNLPCRCSTRGEKPSFSTQCTTVTSLSSVTPDGNTPTLFSRRDIFSSLFSCASFSQPPTAKIFFREYDAVELAFDATAAAAFVNGDFSIDSFNTLVFKILRKLLLETIAVVRSLTVPQSRTRDSYENYNCAGLYNSNVTGVVIAPILGSEALVTYSELGGSTLPERVPRDWSKAITAYSAWLASEGQESEALVRDFNDAAHYCTDSLASCLLELFIDTEQRRNTLALDFSVGRQFPPLGGTPEQAQIHRHAVFDAFAELVIKACDNDSAIATALSNWFKQPGEVGYRLRPSHTILTCAAKIVSDSQKSQLSQNIAAKECTLFFGDKQTRGHERDMCVHFANRLVKRHLRANTRSCLIANS